MIESLFKFSILISTLKKKLMLTNLFSPSQQALHTPKEKNLHRLSLWLVFSRLYPNLLYIIYNAEMKKEDKCRSSIWISNIALICQIAKPAAHHLPTFQFFMEDDFSQIEY